MNVSSTYDLTVTSDSQLKRALFANISFQLSDRLDSLRLTYWGDEGLFRRSLALALQENQTITSLAFYGVCFRANEDGATLFTQLIATNSIPLKKLTFSGGVFHQDILAQFF